MAEHKEQCNLCSADLSSSVLSLQKKPHLVLSKRVSLTSFLFRTRVKMWGKKKKRKKRKKEWNEGAEGGTALCSKQWGEVAQSTPWLRTVVQRAAPGGLTLLTPALP